MSVIAGAAIVTGGGSGIGRAIAEALAREGAPVAVLDVISDGAKETVAAITAARGRAVSVAADVSRWDDVDRAVGHAVRELGPPAIIVSAAGVLDGYATADELAPAVFERVIAINLTGTFFAAKRALAEMLPAGRGRIINLASVAGLIGDGGGAAYVASKHGVVGLTRRLATTYAARGITVNAICPGPITTGLRANSARILGAEAPPLRGIGGDESAIRAVVPAERRGTVEEVAAAALYLASEGAAYVTGQTLVVDGGWTVR